MNKIMDSKFHLSLGFPVHRVLWDSIFFKSLSHNANNSVLRPINHMYQETLNAVLDNHLCSNYASVGSDLL
jgi:hypothetical protein